MDAPGLTRLSSPLTRRAPGCSRHPSRVTRHAVLFLRHASGFTYIGLLIAIALMGAALAGTGVVWHAEARRQKERELLFVGEQFRRAIGQYYERSPGTKKYPVSLDDLLRDPRHPGVQRYLRKSYRDPVTGSGDWGLVMAAEGGIAGIHSLSEGAPIRRANFPPAQSDFEGAERYSDWRFVYLPAVTPAGEEATAR